MTPPAEQMTSSAAPSDRDADRVRDLASRVEAADGAEPLDEQAHLRLAHTTAGVEHLFLRAGATDPAGDLLGYAQLELGDPVTAEILVGLRGRRAQIAAALFERVEDAAGSAPLLVWARGDASPVRAEAERRGYLAARTLLTMSRPLTDLDPGRSPRSDDVIVRAFRPGHDDAAWLGVNARAFDSHPEQGRWTQADLDDRVAQPWFDADGFLLAVAPDGHLLGFHWTKRHSRELGEVYVIGMDPSAQGRGLGRALLHVGLDHLRDTGATTVILYTDEENHGAVRLYEKAGFVVTRRQTQYRRPGGSAPA